METLNSEIWKPILGSILEVSNLGRVRSPRGILKPQLEGGGYLYVRAYNPRRNIKVHIALCEAFHGSRPSELHMALHRDDVKLNNVEGNIYWGLREDNTADMFKNGNKYKRGNDLIGHKNPNASLDWDKVGEIRRRLKLGERRVLLAAEFSVSLSGIQAIADNRTWVEPRAEVMALITAGAK